MAKSPRTIDVLLFDNINLLDVAGPVQAFKEAKVNGQPAYSIRFVGLPSNESRQHDPGTVTACCGLPLATQCQASAEDQHNDLLIPGGDGVNRLLNHQGLQHLIRSRSPAQAASKAMSHSSRLISVCSGAMLLAAAGVLDGKQATAHWCREKEVLDRFPAVEWNLDRIMVKDGLIYTSAGVTTGIDLALALIRDDCGASPALKVAKQLVMYLKRSGGQSQYAQLLEWQFRSDDPLAILIDSLTQHPAREWTLEMMADQAGMSSRTLTRRFSNTFKTSPMKYLEQIRVRLAGDLLLTGITASRVASNTGFSDQQNLRRAFRRQLGVTLGEYQRRFGDTGFQ